MAADDVISVEMKLIDEMSGNLQNISSQMKKSAGEIDSFHGKLQHRFGFIAGEVLQDNLRQLGVSVPGTGRLLSVLEGQVLGLGAAFPIVTLGVAAAVAGFAAVSKVMSDLKEKTEKENAALRDTLGTIKELDSINGAFAKRALQEQASRLQDINKEIQYREKLRELLIGIGKEQIDINSLSGNMWGEILALGSDAIGKNEEYIGSLVKERETIISLMKDVGAEKVKNDLSYQAIHERIANEMIAFDGTAAEIAKANAQNKYQSERVALNKMMQGASDKTKYANELAKLEVLINRETRKQILTDDQNALEKQKFMIQTTIKAYIDSFAILGKAMGVFIATGETAWREMGAQMFEAYAGAIKQMIYKLIIFKQIENLFLASNPFTAVFSVAGAIALAKAAAEVVALEASVSAIASAIRGPSNTGTSAIPNIGPGPIDTNIPGLSGPGVSAAPAEGRAISSASTQVVNYYTIAPNLGILDPSTLTEMTLRNLAATLGKYIQEGKAAGNPGLTR